MMPARQLSKVSVITADSKSTKILAKSFYRELRENGYSCNQILALSTELIDLVTRDLREGEGEPEEQSSSPRLKAAQDPGWRQAL